MTEMKEFYNEHERYGLVVVRCMDEDDFERKCSSYLYDGWTLRDTHIAMINYEGYGNFDVLYVGIFTR